MRKLFVLLSLLVVASMVLAGLRRARTSHPGPRND